MLDTQGDQGEKGDQGAQGPQGPQVITFCVKISTSYRHQNLVCFILQGLQGNPGEKGDPGVSGVQVKRFYTQEFSFIKMNQIMSYITFFTGCKWQYWCSRKSWNQG